MNTLEIPGVDQGVIRSLTGECKLNDAEQFLREYYAQDMASLLALRPAGVSYEREADLGEKRIAAGTSYEPNDRAGIRQWLDKYNGVRNCYFQPNIASGVLHSKASENQIEIVRAIYVDIDIVKSKDREEELLRIADPRLRLYCPFLPL